MTTKDKDRITAMRVKGCSYADIARTLGVADSTVRSFCRRNKSDTTISICKHCGSQFKALPGHKPRLFCSDKCRMLWWNSHPESVHKKAMYNFTCSGCGKSFSAYGNSKRKYCSHACYISGRFGKDENSDE